MTNKPSRHCLHCGMLMRRKNHYCPKVGYVNSWSVTIEKEIDETTKGNSG